MNLINFDQKKYSIGRVTTRGINHNKVNIPYIRGLQLP